MPVEFKSAGNVIHVRLIGAFDFSSQDQFEAIIEQVAAEKLAQDVQVDLARTTFMDSSIIRALLKLRQSTLADGKSLTLWNCNEKMREVFSIGGFDQVFEMR